MNSAQLSLLLFMSVLEERQNHKKRYRTERAHVVFERKRDILAVTLSSEIRDKLGLVAGLDCATERLDGNQVIITFSRKGGFAT